MAGVHCLGSSGGRLDCPPRISQGEQRKGEKETTRLRVWGAEEIPLLIFTFRSIYRSVRILQIKNRKLILLFADLLTVPLASEGFLHALLLTGLQVEGVALDFLDNVFGLHLALETAQSILKGFAFLNSNLCQRKTPPNGPNRDIY
jgi:hypothetical protein